MTSSGVSERGGSKGNGSVISSSRPRPGRCAVLNRGWWNYEWCHGGGVRQFHVDAPTGVEAPSWSLGATLLDRGLVEREVPPVVGGGERGRRRCSSPTPPPPHPPTLPSAAAAYYFTSHFFRGGQHCDETGKGRSTEVQFFCCSQSLATGACGGSVPAAAPLPHAFPPSSSSSAPTIESVEEPATCKYVMRVCLPTLCVPEHPAAAATDPAAAAAAAAPGEEEAEAEAFVGLLWGAVIDGGNEVARELLAPGHYATGAASVRFA